MADEITTSTGTPGATGTAPAAGGATPPEGATPTPEQQTTFQKWLAGLFGGKEAAPAGQESDPATDKGGKQEPQGKTYTEADLQAEIEKAKAAWAAEQQEQARLAKLTPEERANPDLMSVSRKRRIAAGAGVDIAEVNRFVKQFEQSKKMMKQFSGMMGGKKRRGMKFF